MVNCCRNNHCKGSDNELVVNSIPCIVVWGLEETPAMALVKGVAFKKIIVNYFGNKKMAKAQWFCCN